MMADIGRGLMVLVALILMLLVLGAISSKSELQRYMKMRQM